MLLLLLLMLQQLLLLLLFMALLLLQRLLEKLSLACSSSVDTSVIIWVGSAMTGP